METEDEFINEITPHVLNVLAGKQFFEALDDMLCPVDSGKQRVLCKGSYAMSTTLLYGMGFDADDVEDIIQVLSANGGHCDCEILFNVAVDSRLKSEYWKTRATQISQPHEHGM